MRDIRDENTNTTLIDHVALATFLRKLKNALANTTATVDSTHSASPSVQVTFPNLNGGFNFNFSGIKGDAGTSVKILGSFSSTSELPSTGQELGDGYLIDGYLWVYTGSLSQTAVNGFENVGLIKGPDGDPGKDGSVWYNTNSNLWDRQDTVTYTGPGYADYNKGDYMLYTTKGYVFRCNDITSMASIWQYIGCIKGDTGPTGDTGPAGPTGYTESSIDTHYMPTTGTTSIDLTTDYNTVIVTDDNKETAFTYRLSGLNLDPRLHVISGKYDDLIGISEKYNNRPHLPEIGWLIRRTTSYPEGNNIIAIPFYARQEDGNSLIQGYSRVENLGAKDMYRRGSVNLTAYIYDDQKLIETVNNPNFWPSDIQLVLNGNFCGPTAAVAYLENRYGLFGGIVTDNHIGLSERIELDCRNFWTIINQDYTHRYEIDYKDRYKTGNPHNSSTRSKKRTNICVKKSAVDRDDRYNNPCNLLITDTCKNNICVNFDISDQLLAHDFFGLSWSGRMWEYEPIDYKQLNSFTFMFVQNGIVEKDEYFEGGLGDNGNFVNYDEYEDDNDPKGWYQLYKLLETESQSAIKSGINDILLFEQEQS